jgi:hypothetical protein
MGCLKLLFALLVAAAVASLAYLNRDRFAALLGTDQPATEVASPELAQAADDKLADLESGTRRMVALTEPELQSLLLYKYRELLPAFVDSPRVELNGDKIVVRGRVPRDRLPQLDELGSVAELLPDTTELGVTGAILPLHAGRVALAVDQIRAARIPLPQRVIPAALRKLGRKDEPGLPDDALALPLPPGADAAYVRGDSLIFMSNGGQRTN